MNYYSQGSSATRELAHAQNGYTPGKFGKIYITYLQEYRRGFFNQLVTSNDLNMHVKDVEERAEDKYNYLLSTTIIKEKIDDELKSNNRSVWRKKMDAAKKAAEEETIKTVIFN